MILLYNANNWSSVHRGRILVNDIKALSKVYLINMLSNKFVFIFNLLFPTVFFLYNHLHSLSNPKGYFSQNTLAVLSCFWAYIIIVTIINNVIVSVIAWRESGFYKQLFFIVGSKWKILTALFLVQLIVINLELLVFNIIVMIVYQYWHTGYLLAGLLVTLLVALPVAFICSLLFMLKVKIESINIFTSIILFVSFLYVTLPDGSNTSELLFLVNPVLYIADTAYLMLLFVFKHTVHIEIMFAWLGVTALYLVLGWFAISKLTVNAIADRA